MPAPLGLKHPHGTSCFRYTSPVYGSGEAQDALNPPQVPHHDLVWICGRNAAIFKNTTSPRAVIGPSSQCRPRGIVFFPTVLLLVCYQNRGHHLGPVSRTLLSTSHLQDGETPACRHAGFVLLFSYPCAASCLPPQIHHESYPVPSTSTPQTPLM